jgi:hypothetical protein
MYFFDARMIRILLPLPRVKSTACLATDRAFSNFIRLCAYTITSQSALSLYRSGRISLTHRRQYHNFYCLHFREPTIY